jgi:hypothetical protein
MHVCVYQKAAIVQNWSQEMFVGLLVVVRSSAPEPHIITIQ